MCLIHDCWCKKKYKTSTLQYIRWPSKFLALGLFGERLRAKSFHHQGLVYEPPWSATSSTSPTAMTVTTTTSPRRQRRSQPVKPGKRSATLLWGGPTLPWWLSPPHQFCAINNFLHWIQQRETAFPMPVHIFLSWQLQLNCMVITTIVVTALTIIFFLC